MTKEIKYLTKIRSILDLQRLYSSIPTHQIQIKQQISKTTIKTIFSNKLTRNIFRYTNPIWIQWYPGQ